MSRLTEDTRQPGDPIIDATKNRMVALNYVGKVLINVMCPEVVHDLYNKHNANMTKHPIFARVMKPMFSDVFLVMPTNDEWRNQRKAVSHMFFKQRLQLMAEVFKQYLNISCDKWLSEIAASKDGETRIDIAVEFEKIFGHTINHICLGENINDDLFDFRVLTIADEKCTFTEKKVTLREAIHNMAF